jgi:hypothetical protein
MQLQDHPQPFRQARKLLVNPIILGHTGKYIGHPIEKPSWLFLPILLLLQQAILTEHNLRHLKHLGIHFIIDLITMLLYLGLALLDLLPVLKALNLLGLPSFIEERVNGVADPLPEENLDEDLQHEFVAGLADYHQD